MANQRKKILIVGLFLSESNKTRILRTAADQLAELLSKNNIPIIKVSTIVNKLFRFVDTMFTILSKSGGYKIAIVPLYGGNMSLVWAKASIWLLKLLGKKIVLIVHGGSIPTGMKVKPDKYLGPIKNADVVVCPSNYILTALEEHSVKSELIENVVNLDEYHFHAKESFRPTIFWMRTLEDIYNPEMAVRVGALLAKKYPEFKMVMAGYDLGSLKLVQQLAEELKVTDNIELPGYISNDRKNEYAQSLDIYICTNRIDNAPVSFIEMMALGLPVVSVNVGGIPFLLKHRFNGLLVELDDDVAMADCISSIIDQPALGKQLVKNGVEFSKAFGEQQVMQKWKRLFEKLNYN